MTPRLFTKHYRTPQQCAAAARHHAWLSVHARPLRQPDLHEAAPRHLVFQHVEGRHAEPGDLPRLAALLGDAHGAAWTSKLHRARFNQPLRLPDGGCLHDYVASRTFALQRRWEQGHLANYRAMREMSALLRRSANGPVAFYKDSNPRNFLITVTGDVYTVDVDDLTLAPFGYDLAKLIHTLTLAHGPLAPDRVREALGRYNHAASRHHVILGSTHSRRLADFLELHRVLTAPYEERPHYPYAQQQSARSRPEGSA